MIIAPSNRAGMSLTYVEINYTFLCSLIIRLNWNSDDSSPPKFLSHPRSNSSMDTPCACGTQHTHEQKVHHPQKVSHSTRPPNSLSHSNAKLNPKHKKTLLLLVKVPGSPAPGSCCCILPNCMLHCRNFNLRYLPTHHRM